MICSFHWELVDCNYTVSWSTARAQVCEVVNIRRVESCCIGIRDLANPSFPLRKKSDVPATLSAFYSYVSTQFGRPILALQTDNGKEFDNLSIRSLLSTHGTIFRLTCPYTSQQNGRAERVLRTLNDCVHTLLFHAHIPLRFGLML